MALHIFVNAETELLIHVFRGDKKEAERFMKHTSLQGQPARHICVDHGSILVGSDNGVVLP